MRRHILYLLVFSVCFSLGLPKAISAATVNYTENPGTSWMKLNSNGNNVHYLLHNSADGNNLEIGAYNNGAMKWQALSVNKNGNVGIGTNNAQSNLHVAGDALIGRPGGSSLIIQTPSSDIRMYGIGGKPFLIPEGNVCIGCYLPTHKLSVNGTIKAREILVSTQNWADYVFEDGYYLMPLIDLEKFINANGHLPNIPSASKIESGGIPVGDMQRLQMEKIEELTLHLIEKDKEINDLKTRMENLEKLLIN